MRLRERREERSSEREREKGEKGKGTCRSQEEMRSLE